MDPNVKKSATNLDAFDPMLKNERLQFSEGIRYEGTGRNIFKVEVPVSSRPHRPEPTHSSGVPPNESSLQTVRLRFFGFASAPGDFKRIFLSNDGDVFIGREGEIVNRRYRILQITPTSVDVEDLINGCRQRLLLDQG